MPKNPIMCHANFFNSSTAGHDFEHEHRALTGLKNVEQHRLPQFIGALPGASSCMPLLLGIAGRIAILM